MKKIYQYGILSGFLALCACGNNSDNMDASGTFEATEVIVSAEANGKIEQLDIEEGSIVTARQKLGYIDTVQLYLQKEQLLKNYRSVMKVTARYKQTNCGYKTANRDGPNRTKENYQPA